MTTDPFVRPPSAQPQDSHEDDVRPFTTPLQETLNASAPPPVVPQPSEPPVPAAHVPAASHSREVVIVSNSQVSTTSSLPTALHTSSLADLQEEEGQDEILIECPHPSEFVNAAYIQRVGSVLYKWLGLCIGNGGQFITSVITVMVTLYHYPTALLPSTMNPFAAAFLYFVIRLVFALIISFFLQTVLALGMVFCIDDLSKVLNLQNAYWLVSLLIGGMLLAVILFSVGANFYSDGTVVKLITTSPLIIGLFIGIQTLCSTGGTVVGRVIENYGASKQDWLYTQKKTYHEWRNEALPADVLAYFARQQEMHDARGFKRVRMKLLA